MVWVSGRNCTVPFSTKNLHILVQNLRVCVELYVSWYHISYFQLSIILYRTCRRKCLLPFSTRNLQIVPQNLRVCVELYVSWYKVYVNNNIFYSRAAEMPNQVQNDQSQEFYGWFMYQKGTYGYQKIFVTVLIDRAFFSYARARAGMIGTQSKRDLLDSVFESNEFNDLKSFVSQVF